MKVNVMGLLRGAAMELKFSDPARAFTLLEFGNNLRMVMRGEATLEEWQAVYVGADSEPFDIDKLLPTPAEGRPNG
jgi:hypothetical protein